MLTEFKTDLEKAKAAEKIVLDTLNSLTTGYKFIDVSNNRECFYKGDICGIAADGKEIYIEVKDDKRIAKTRNVLCEEENYIKDDDRYIKGAMYNDTDVYCVVSQEERKIYVIDFKVLRQIYKKGEFKIIPHFEQDTFCYLLELWMIKKYNGLIAVLEY